MSNFNELIENLPVATYEKNEQTVLSESCAKYISSVLSDNYAWVLCVVPQVEIGGKTELSMPTNMQLKDDMAALLERCNNALNQNNVQQHSKG